MISAVTGIPCGKDEPIASREMGQCGVDIRLVGPAREAFPFSVECKNCEKWNIPMWIEQAKTNQMLDTDWLLVFSRNRAGNVVVMDADAFFRIWKRYLKMQKRLIGE